MANTTIPDDTYKPEVQPSTQNACVLIVTADKTEDLEFFYPYYRLIEAGYRVDVATPDGGAFKGKLGAGLKETKSLKDVDPASYQLLYIPGGKAPERLKQEPDAVRIVQEFVSTGKPVAAICHGPQLLAKAEVISGRKISAWPEVQEEVEEAGAAYVNEACVMDGQFISGRWPADLPLFTAKLIETLQQGKGFGQSGNFKSAA